MAFVLARRQNKISYLFTLLSLLLAIVVAAAPGLAQKPASPRQQAMTRASAVGAASGSASTRPLRPHLMSKYAKLPLAFEVNQGQTDPKVKFLSHAAGYSLFLTSNEALLSFPGSDHQAVLSMKLSGANPHPELEGVDELSGKSNYLIGNDPAKWRTNVAQYAKVKYRNIYPGINLVYYGNQRDLEYDFVVKPWSDPTAIRFRFEGANGMRVDRFGNLVVNIGKESLALKKPIIYQNVHGARRTISGRYLISDRQVSFKIENYDHDRELVIDPVLDYSTYIGPAITSGIAVDGDGNAYVVGSTSWTEFPTTPGAFQDSLHISCGQQDSFCTVAFVTKLNADGSDLLYSTFIGGSGASHDLGNAIFVDGQGNAHIAGYTRSFDFPTTMRAIQIGCGPCVTGSAFLAVLNPTGSELLYSTYLGGQSGFQGDTAAYSIAVDRHGFDYITGYTDAPDFVTTANAFQSKTAGHGDAFVSKLDVFGAESALVYSTYLGGTMADSGNAIAVDSKGNIYVAGATGSRDFPVTTGAFQTVYGGGEQGSLYGDVFVAKLASSGDKLVFSTYLGGSNTDFASSVRVDHRGNVYVSGSTRSRDFPVSVGVFQPSFAGDQGDMSAMNAFASKLDSRGERLIFSTYLGGGGTDYGSAIAVERDGEVWVSGTTNSIDFPTTPDALQPTSFEQVCEYGLRCRELYVSLLSADASRLIYSTYLGGTRNNWSAVLTLDRQGNLFVGGHTSSLDFPVTENAFRTSCPQYVDQWGESHCEAAFLLKMYKRRFPFEASGR